MLSSDKTNFENMHPEPITLASRQSAITSHWSPEHILTVNGTHSFKLATFQGEFIWHSHPDTDEVFYCVSGGPLVLEVATDPESKHEKDGFQTVELQVGDLFNVGRGCRHRPRTSQETGVLMIEKVGTVNTGDEAESVAGRVRTKVVREA